MADVMLEEATSPFIKLAASLAAVSLEQVNELAGLQTRIDRKYVINVEAATAAIAALGPEVSVMQIGLRRKFTYRSLYFDTPDLVSYRSTATGRRRRYKVRTRHYVDGGLCVLEVKTQSGRGETLKERIAHPLDDVGLLTETAQEFIDACLHQPGLGRTLTPVMWTGYQRTTLVDTQECSRYTLDEDLSRALPDGPWRRLGSAVVLETKAKQGATGLDRVLWAAGIRPVAMSKFGVSMAITHPLLPSNKYDRLIRNHFTAGTEHPIDEG